MRSVAPRWRQISVLSTFVDFRRRVHASHTCGALSMDAYEFSLAKA